MIYIGILGGGNNSYTHASAARGCEGVEIAASGTVKFAFSVVTTPRLTHLHYYPCGFHLTV